MKKAWTLSSAGNGPTPAEWRVVAQGDDADMLDLMEQFLRWRLEGQRVRLEWSEVAPPETPEGVDGFSITGR